MQGLAPYPAAIDETHKGHAVRESFVGSTLDGGERVERTRIIPAL
jgi:hypothetical protein